MFMITLQLWDPFLWHYPVLKNKSQGFTGCCLVYEVFTWEGGGGREEGEGEGEGDDK